MASLSRRILVVGGGPAGSVTAYWLGKAGFDVLVAERSTRPPYGQGLDITDGAVEVVRKMGLWDKIKSRTTGEAGTALIDDEGKDLAVISGVTAADGTGVPSVTQEIEIMRGDLTKVFADAAKAFPTVQYRYGCTVSEIRQGDKSVTAVLSDDGKAEEFTAIIGADGKLSKVRNLAFERKVNQDCYRPLDTYVAYFSVAGDPSYDVPNSKCQHGNKGRLVWMRPIDRKANRVSFYLMLTGENKALDLAAKSGSQVQQKAALDEVFRDFRGLGPRAIRGMHECGDFHFARLEQVKLDSWHSGRCGLVGDAGWCPSPLTGQGTTLAIMGGYMLAGELARNPDDPQAAFTEYLKKFEGFVAENSAIPLGGKAPKIFLPQTDLGVWTVRTIFRFVCWSGALRLIHLFDFGGDAAIFKLPPYEFEI